MEQLKKDTANSENNDEITSHENSSHQRLGDKNNPFIVSHYHLDDIFYRDCDDSEVVLQPSNLTDPPGHEVMEGKRIKITIDVKFILKKQELYKEKYETNEGISYKIG